MRIKNKITEKMVNPALVEHLDVKNVKKYVGCDRLIFDKLKTIHPFSIASLSVVPVSNISLGHCNTYEGIGKDLATLQVERLNASQLHLNVKDVIDLLQSKTVLNLELSSSFITELKEEEWKEFQNVFNQFKGKVRWDSTSIEVSKIKFKSAKLLQSIDASDQGRLSAEYGYRNDGLHERRIQLKKVSDTYRATEPEVLSKALVLSSLLDMAEEDPEEGRKAVILFKLGENDKNEEINRMLEIIKLLDDLLEDSVNFDPDSDPDSDYETFTSREVLDTPEEMLNTFFKNKKCALNLDLSTYASGVDQRTFENLTDRPLRRLEVTGENIDVTKLGKKFSLLKTSNATLALDNVRLEATKEGEESPAHRIGKIIKLAADLCKGNEIIRPFEITIADRPEEITYDSFMPIIEAVNCINENAKKSTGLYSVGVKSFSDIDMLSIKIPSACVINNKLVKAIKEFVKVNRTLAPKEGTRSVPVRINQPIHTGAMHTGSTPDKALILDPRDRAYAMKLYA